MLTQPIITIVHVLLVNFFHISQLVEIHRWFPPLLLFLKEIRLRAGCVSNPNTLVVTYVRQMKTKLQMVNVNNPHCSDRFGDFWGLNLPATMNVAKILDEA